MPTSIREEDRCWSEMLASSYTHYGAKGRQTPATLILGAYDKLVDAKQLFFELHSKLHLSSMTGTEKNDVDYLLHDLVPHEYSIMPTSKDKTIAWVLWHIARIEDLTMGILAADGNQLFNDEWKKRLNVSISDTGNALLDDEIMELSRQLNIKELISYRNAVGQRTRDIVMSLSASEMKRMVFPHGLEAVMQAGGVTSDENSLWLLDFWGKKMWRVYYLCRQRTMSYCI